METFLFWVVIIGAIIYFSNKSGTAPKQTDKNNSAIVLKNISLEPVVITPIQPDKKAFSKKALVEAAGLPYVEGSWLTMNKDHGILKSYASHLDNHRYQAQQEAQNAIYTFENDHTLLVDQQMQIFRRAYQARSLLMRFTELQLIPFDISKLPGTFQITLPAVPEYLTPVQLDKKYGLIPSTAGHAFSKLVTPGGGFGTKGNLIVAAIGAAALAINAKATISKLTRALEIAKADISSYCISLKTTIGVLAKSHTEIVNVSAQLKEAETTLIAIIEKVKVIPETNTTISQLEAEEKDQMLILYFLLLQAEQHGLINI